MAKNKSSLDGYPVAPINRKGLEEVLAQTELLNTRFIILEEAIEQKAMDSHQNALEGGLVRELRDNGLSITDDLYYMLSPKSIAQITKSHSTASNLMAHVINNAMTMNTGKNVPLSYMQMQKFALLHNFRKTLGQDVGLLNGMTVTAMDIETIGGSPNKNGVTKLYGIYDYGMINLDHKGQAKKYSGLIGFQRGSKTDTYLSKIIEKVENGASFHDLDKDEQITFEYLSRLGVSKEKIVKQNGRWINTGLEKEGVQTFEDFKTGVEKLREIGEEQVREMGQLGGYKNLIDDLAEVSARGNHNYFLGHNFSQFDSPHIKYVLNTVPGAKEYALSKGLNVNAILHSDNIIDTLAPYNTMHPKERLIADKGIYGEEGVNAYNPGGTGGQLESLHAAEFGISKKDIHHNGIIDSGQTLGIMGFVEDPNNPGTYIAKDTKYIKYVETPFLQKYKSSSYDENGRIFQSRIMGTANVSGNDIANNSVYMVPKRSQFLNDLVDPNAFFTLQRGDTTYYSDGKIGVLDKATGNMTIKNGDGKFFPSFSKTKNSYEIIPESYGIIDDPEILKQVSYGRNGIEASQRLVTFQMKVLANEKEKALSKANDLISVFVAEDHFQDFILKNFDVVQVGNTPTEAGKLLGSRIYRKTGENLTGQTQHFPREYSVQEAFKGQKERETIENVSRRIDEGSFSALEKGIAVRDIADHGGIQLEELRSAIIDLHDDGSQAAVDRFLKVVSGVTLDQRLEAYSRNALGGDFRNPQTWLNTWRLNGTVNRGWMDNSLFMAGKINSNSMGVQYVRQFNGAWHSNSEGKQIRYGLGLLMDWQAGMSSDEEVKRRAYGIVSGQADWSMDRGIRNIQAESFIKSHLPRKSAPSSTFIPINGNHPDSTFNSIFRAINLDPNSLPGKHTQIGIVDQFIDSIIDTYSADKEFQNSEARKDLVELARNTKFTAKDKATRLGEIIGAHEYFQHEMFMPQTNPRNTISSTIFTEEATDKALTIAKQVAGEVKETIQNSVPDTKKMMTEHLLGKTENEFINDFQEALRRGNLGEKAFNQRKVIMLKQVESVKAFGDNLVDSIQKSGGALYKGKNNHIFVNFGGAPIDITSQLPYLVSNGNGITYTRLGASSYITGLEGRYTAKGAWDVRTLVDKMRYRTFSSLDDNLKKAEALGQRQGDILMSALSHGAEALREKVPDATPGLQMDYLRNSVMDFSEMLKNSKKRGDFLTYLKSINDPTENIKTLIKELENAQKSAEKYGEERISSTTLTALTQTWEEGSLASSFDLESRGIKAHYNLNANLKDTTAEKGKISIINTNFGDQAITGNISSSSAYVEQSTLNVLDDRLNKAKRVYDNKIKTGNDLIVSQIHGIGVTNKIRVKKTDLTNRIKDELIQDALSKKNITELQAKQLSQLIHLREGGGAVSGDIVRAADYRDGRKVINIEYRDVLESSFRNRGIDFGSTEIKFVRDEKTGQYRIKYGQGFAAGRKDPILESFSTFDASSIDEAARGSIVKEQFLLGENKDIVLTEEEANNYINKLIAEGGKSFDNASEYRQFVNSKLNRRLVANPISYANTVKIKDDLAEKHMATVVMSRLRDDTDDAVMQKFLASKQVAAVNRFLGEDIGEAFLTDEVFEDIVEGKFQLPIWKIKDITDEDRNELRAMFLSTKAEQDARKEARNQLSKTMQEVFHSELLVDSLQDAAKHKEFGKEIRLIHDQLVRFYGAEKAAQILSKGISFDGDGKLTLNPDGSLRLPDGVSYDVDLNKIQKAIYDGEYLDEGQVNKYKKLIDKRRNALRADYEKEAQKLKDDIKKETVFESKEDIDKAKVHLAQAKEAIENSGFLPLPGEAYKSYTSIAKVPQEMAKKPKLDQRTLDTLRDQIYDIGVIKEVNRAMIDAGMEDEFGKTFSDILDRQYTKGLKEFELNKKLAGTSVWSDKAFIAETGGFITDDEEVFSKVKGQKAKEPINARRNQIANETRKKFGVPIVSKEYVNDIIHAQDVQGAMDIEKNIEIGSESEAERVAQKYGYQNVSADDVRYDYKKNRISYIADDNALWKKNAIIDLTDESIGLDKKFFSDTYLGQDKIVVPGHDPEMFERRSGAKPNEDLHLKDYQKKASGILATREEIQHLSNRLKEVTDEDQRSIILSEIDKKKDSLKKKITDYRWALRNYAKSTKEDGVLYSRMNKGQSLSNRANSFVFDVDAWTKEGARIGKDGDTKYLTLADNFTYKGRSLKEMWQHGDKVSFTIASTDDLAKYGFSDDYFKVNHIDKAKWLEKAKTQGIAALVHRDPNDYHGSTVATQLYFSDKVSRGITMTDHITAAQMKQDVDGDNVATYVLGARNRNGKLVDLSSITDSSLHTNFVATKVNNQRNNIKAAETLSKVHDRSIAMNAFYYRKKFLDEGSEKFRDGLGSSYQNRLQKAVSIDEQRNKSLSSMVEGIIHSDAREFFDDKTRQQLQASWSNAKQTMDSIAGSFNIDLGKKSEMEYHEAIKNFISDKEKAGSISESQLSALKSGFRSHIKYVTPTASYLARTSRGRVGEIDTQFNVIDRLRSFATDQRTSELLDEGKRMVLTDSDIQALSYLKESSKEGFLTPKKSDFEVLRAERQSLPKTTQGYVDALIRSRGTDQKAKQGLIDSIMFGGRNVVNRNNVTQILGKDRYNEIKRMAEMAGKDVEEALHRASVETGVESFAKMIGGFSKDFTDQGVFGVYSGNKLMALNSLTKASTEWNAEYKKIFDDAGFKDAGALRKKALQSSQEAIQDNVNNLGVVQNMRRLPKLNSRPDMDRARSIVVRRSASGWGRNMLFFAAGILALGYAGGNPANSVGREANNYPPQQPNYMSPIPSQRDGSLNAMRNGPRQGYIVNIKGSARMNNNDYIGNAISQAVRQNYNNAQININVNTQDQSSITYDQIYDYVEQAVF